MSARRARRPSFLAPARVVTRGSPPRPSATSTLCPSSRPPLDYAFGTPPSSNSASLPSPSSSSSASSSSSSPSSSAHVRAVPPRKVSQVPSSHIAVTHSPPQDFGPPVTIDEMMQSLHGEDDPLWQVLRREAATAAAGEPQLASGLYAAILVHNTFEETLATVLANILGTEQFAATQWVGLFRDALNDDENFGKIARADIAAFMERDPASAHAARVLLFAKGFQALQCWRLSSWLWRKGRRSLALYLQSMVSSLFAVDIHPAATIGSGVLIDHGTGIVIGETASVGNNVSILHNVTLGGTGKETGDRHPKVEDGVMIGAGATILGNIKVGMGAHIAACSVVLKPVESFAVISGVPGKMVGKVRYEAGVMPSFVMDQRLSIETMGVANPYQDIVKGSVMGVEDSADDQLFGGSSI